jgi:hypothetical protein
LGPCELEVVRTIGQLDEADAVVVALPRFDGVAGRRGFGDVGRAARQAGVITCKDRLAKARIPPVVEEVQVRPTLGRPRSAIPELVGKGQAMPPNDLYRSKRKGK